MKKQILISLALFGAGLSLYSQNAQWSGATPGSIYYNQGNVGIGISSPTNKLHLFSGWNDFKYTKFEAQYLGHQASILEINGNSGGWGSGNRSSDKYDQCSIWSWLK